MAAAEANQGKIIYEQEGIFVDYAGAEEDILLNGKVTITDKSFGVFVQWEQIDEPEYLFEQSNEWDVVNRAAATNGTDVSLSKSQKQRLKTIKFELSDLKSFQYSDSSKGWPDITFIQKDGTTHPTMNFHLGKIEELLSILDKYIKTKRSKAEKNLWLVVDPNLPDTLERSLTELNLYKHPKKRFGLDMDSYTTAMSQFSKVTKFLYDYVVADNSDSRPISDMEAILHDNLPLEINQADAGFELITHKDLIPRPTVVRGDPLTQEEWIMHIDEVGRVTGEDELKEKIFRGGISHSIRCEVWKFLLNVYSFDTTFEIRKEIKKENVDDYYRMKLQWKTISKVQESRFSDLRDRKSLIDKDVSRTDRTHPYYEGDNNENLGILRDILMTYCMYNFDLGYVQGMSDLLAPILVVMENEVDAFWCFVGFMERICHNFEMDQQGMKTQLRQLFSLLHFIDPELCDYLESCDSGNLYFCFRWLLIVFKREFKFPEIMKLWEVLWTDKPCKNFHLLFCYAILDSEKEIIMENRFGFTEILKHVNDLSQHIRLEENLAKAESVYLQLVESRYLPQSIQDILGIILPPDVTDSSETLIEKPDLPPPVNNKSPQSNTSSVENSSIELLYDVDAEAHYQMTMDYNL